MMSLSVRRVRGNLVCVRLHETAIAEAARTGKCFWIQRGDEQRTHHRLV
jgi:hypothetical protein